MSKAHYSVDQTHNLEELKLELSLILRSIEERLDEVQGERGTSTIKDALVIGNDLTTLHGFNTE